MENIKAHIIIKGRVQGVGYRYWTRKEALKRKLSGWVKNLPNGDVEALFIGSHEKVSQMIILCKKGPVFANVTSIKPKKDNNIEDIVDGKFNIIT